jgi:hypothetical protein
LLVIGEYQICQYGCASANVAPFVGTCIDCRKEYTTGKPHADQCEDCELKEDARYRREAAGDEISPTGYSARLRADGASRRAYEMGKK